MASEEARKDASAFVDTWSSAAGPQAFTQMDKAIVAAQLKERIEQPWMIQQGSAGLCAPAGFSYETALHQPFVYAQAVANLFNYGKAEIGKLKIKPCSDLRTAQCPTNTPQADWILLASIRDQLNWFFDYVTDEYDKNASGHGRLERRRGAAGRILTRSRACFAKRATPISSGRAPRGSRSRRSCSKRPRVFSQQTTRCCCV